MSLCRAIDGVVDAVSNLSYAVDDTTIPSLPNLSDS